MNLTTDQKLSKLDEFLMTFPESQTQDLAVKRGTMCSAMTQRMRCVSGSGQRMKSNFAAGTRPVVEFDLYKIMSELLIEKHPAKIRRPRDADRQHDTRGECGEQCFADRTTDGPYKWTTL